jgi:hypothetical protein
LSPYCAHQRYIISLTLSSNTVVAIFIRSGYPFAGDRVNFSAGYVLFYEEQSGHYIARWVTTLLLVSDHTPRTG